MARRSKPAAGAGRTVRLSVVMGAEDHKRLAALALATDRTINQVVLDLVLPHLATVRIPWIVPAGSSEPSEGPGTAARRSA